MRARLTLALLWLGTLLPGFAQEQARFDDVRAVGTEFQVTLSDGRILNSAHLVGAVLSVADPQGRLQAVRIEAVEPDPSDPDILLHTLSVQDPATGRWQDFCEPGAEGVPNAFPMSGRWTEDGRHLRDDVSFALICAGGAIGKCVRWGYKPWRSAANGESLWDYHQACVRMVRADYGGDGIGHTRDDTLIDVFDRLGLLQPAADPGMLAFEAAWGPDGAVCVRRPRIPDIISAEELERQYPRLRGQTGETCREDWTRAGVLILNRS